MNLTRHFAAMEMRTTSSGLNNAPTIEAWINMTRLCCEVLEPLREICGPLKINSGYRSPEVNKKIGGAKNSAHTFGRAADVVPIDKALNALDLILALQDSGISFDKAILEYRGRGLWLHVQVRHVKRKPRRVLLQSLESGSFEKFNANDPRLKRWLE